MAAARCGSGHHRRKEAYRDPAVPEAEHLTEWKLHLRLEHAIGGEERQRPAAAGAARDVAELRVQVAERAAVTDAGAVRRVGEQQPALAAGGNAGERRSAKLDVG